MDEASPTSPALPTTQRAYTLRLRAAVGPGDDDAAKKRKHAELSDALWATHEAVNKGAKVFGDWLLTLRGGLCHTLAEPPPSAKGKERSEEETAALRKNRRILLSLSWLSVEDARGAPKGEGVCVATGKDSPEVRKERVLTAFRSILAGRGCSAAEIESWVSDCEGSLGSRIREDAVWVNRSSLFDAAVERVGPTLTREEVWDILKPFFGSRESYLAPVTLADDDEGRGDEEKAKDLVQKAGQWLSSRFGTGQGADFGAMATVYEAMAVWAQAATGFDNGLSAIKNLAGALTPFNPSSSSGDGILVLISGPGYKSATRNLVKAWDGRTGPVTGADLQRFAETAASDRANSLTKVGGKGRRPWSDRVLEAVEQECGFTYLQKDGPARHSEFAVMLDHAARRVSIGHSWIKRAEAQRVRFEGDAARLGGVPAAAGAWIDALVVERSGNAGGEYRIRRRAIEGWDKVLERWDRKDCATVADRIKAARELQDNPEIEKFGDIQLFEALAADDAQVVWRSDGKRDAGVLRDYVLGHDARFRQRHYKVPAYRHPDPLRHPVFGDFGNSRWDIAYAVHESAKAAGAKRKRNGQTAAWLSDRWGLRMGLWTGSDVKPVELRWSSKRLAKDLAFDIGGDDRPVRAVTRADRLGRAAAGARPGEATNAAGLFALADWNGRLQAPRAELDAIARRVDRCGWDLTARAKLGRLSWLVSFSAKLECRGPFIDYICEHDDGRPDRPFLSKKSGEMAVAHDGNSTRKSLAKLALSRLPGLRVLSVDLGHRFAASCAVWEAISADAMKKEVGGRAVRAGGMGAADLFCHVETPTARLSTRGRNKGKPVTEVAVYRRIGEDFLRDPKTGIPTNTLHPAPWARLDRQFLIKLRGEERPARKCSDAETSLVKSFEQSIGRWRTAEHDQLPDRADMLTAEAVRSARLGLRRHGDAARIAYAFMPKSLRHAPGGRTEEHTPESRNAAILDALVRWNELAGTPTSRWRDGAACTAWDEHIAPRLSTALPQLPEESTGPERKAHRKRMEETLVSVAASMAKTGDSGVPELFGMWQTRWEADHAAWQGRLKKLNRWLLPHGLRALRGETDEQAKLRKARLGAARNMGGLSLTRIATTRELWQVQKAFHYGPRPCDLRAGVRKIEEDSAAGRKFGDTALRAMERMREQRVKQIASRIAASALGLGGHWKTVLCRDHAGKPLLDENGGKRTRRVWVEEPDAKYAPCHAVVIEDLKNYRPDQLQTRRENKALMVWSSSKVAKYLGEACQLNGLHLREVRPNYTSQQCSRTGLPGVRCVDVPVNAEAGEPDAYWWKRALAAAEKKAGKDGTGGDAESRLVVAVACHLRDLKKRGAALPKRVRLPRRGGDLFVAAPSWNDLRAGGCAPGTALQADLNAAANIGLRALLDPDFAGKWWYVPCETATGKPAGDKCTGSACIDLDAALLDAVPAEPDGGKKAAKAKKSKIVTNAWHDVAESGNWKPHGHYWNDVSMRVIERLRQANGLDSGPIDPPDTPF